MYKDPVLAIENKTSREESKNRTSGNGLHVFSSLMDLCWVSIPSIRPSFAELFSAFENLQRKFCPQPQKNFLPHSFSTPGEIRNGDVIEKNHENSSHSFSAFPTPKISQKIPDPSSLEVYNINTESNPVRRTTSPPSPQSPPDINKISINSNQNNNNHNPLPRVSRALSILPPNIETIAIPLHSQNATEIKITQFFSQVFEKKKIKN